MNKRDVQEFFLHLADNIIALNRELSNKTYRHGGYNAFNISDPKPRNIHKAGVRDRLLHHAIYRILYPFFDKKFIADSYSCQIGKGTHKALNKFCKFAYIVSKNKTKTCWILKCDIRKFFASIDHRILMKILAEYIPDKDILWLFEEIIGSFFPREGVGLPLGNLTSQLLVNIYMNRFDQFIKRKLRIKYYIRYADDFVIFSEKRFFLEQQVYQIQKFLGEDLRLKIHPDKIFIKTLASGIDFLGWINFSDHRILRTSTKRRIIKRVKENPALKTISSYIGLLSHGNAQKLQHKILINPYRFCIFNNLVL